MHIVVALQLKLIPKHLVRLGRVGDLTYKNWCLPAVEGALFVYFSQNGVLFVNDPDLLLLILLRVSQPD